MYETLPGAWTAAGPGGVGTARGLEPPTVPQSPDPVRCPPYSGLHRGPSLCFYSRDARGVGQYHRVPHVLGRQVCEWSPQDLAFSSTLRTQPGTRQPAVGTPHWAHAFAVCPQACCPWGRMLGPQTGSFLWKLCHTFGRNTRQLRCWMCFLGKHECSGNVLALPRTAAVETGGQRGARDKGSSTCALCWDLPPLRGLGWGPVLLWPRSGAR